MNCVQKGCSRDKQIVRLVDTCGALTTDQVHALLFGQMKAGQRKAQQRLKRLYETKRLKRCRLAINEPYAYYTDRKSGQLEHRIMVNWIYTWMRVRLASWETLIWEYEPDYNVVRPDGFAAIKNNVTGSYKFYFIEADRSANPWDKTAKYNRMYELEEYLGRWWVQHTKRFPAIICVTTDDRRARTIQESIAKENANGLQFEVRLLPDLIQEVRDRCKH